MKNVKHYAEFFPLALIVFSQAATIGIWQFRNFNSGISWFDLTVAVITAFSFDLLIVHAAMTEKPNYFTYITAILAMCVSAVISMILFWEGAYNPSSYVHSAFPVLAFFYSLHVNEGRRLTASTNSVIMSLSSKEEKAKAKASVEGKKRGRKPNGLKLEPKTSEEKQAV